MKTIVTLLVVMPIFMESALSDAQQPTKVPRIGYLTGATPDGQSHRIEAFRQGLRELGYVEGKNISIEYRFAEGKPDRLPALAAELVRLKVDIIVTSGAPATRSAKEATVTIPIVMTNDTDPVGSGFVASLARPGGNITGLLRGAENVSHLMRRSGLWSAGNRPSPFWGGVGYSTSNSSRFPPSPSCCADAFGQPRLS